MSKTLRANAVAIVLARRVLIAVAFGLILFFVGFAIDVNRKPPYRSSGNSQEINANRIGKIGSAYFTFDILDTHAKRVRGLSGSDELSAARAMLFVFDAPATQCIWMKDMNFSIDIMWFDENKTLIHEERNVSPDTYPHSFCPEKPAKYVVEVTAGVAEKNHIKLGDTLDLEL